MSKPRLTPVDGFFNQKFDKDGKSMGNADDRFRKLRRWFDLNEDGTARYPDTPPEKDIPMGEGKLPERMQRVWAVDKPNNTMCNIMTWAMLEISKERRDMYTKRVKHGSEKLRNLAKSLRVAVDAKIDDTKGDNDLDNFVEEQKHVERLKTLERECMRRELSVVRAINRPDDSVTRDTNGETYDRDLLAEVLERAGETLEKDEEEDDEEWYGDEEMSAQASVGTFGGDGPQPPGPDSMFTTQPQDGEGGGFFTTPPPLRPGGTPRVNPFAPQPAPSPQPPQPPPPLPPLPPRDDLDPAAFPEWMLQSPMRLPADRPLTQEELVMLERIINYTKDKNKLADFEAERLTSERNLREVTYKNQMEDQVKQNDLLYEEARQKRNEQELRLAKITKEENDQREIGLKNQKEVLERYENLKEDKAELDRLTTENQLHQQRQYEKLKEDKAELDSLTTENQLHQQRELAKQIAALEDKPSEDGPIPEWDPYKAGQEVVKVLETILDEYKGNAGLKDEIYADIVGFLADGKASVDRYRNYAFMGPSGVGKTTWAKMMGKIYKAVGMYLYGIVDETSSTDYLGVYVASTGPKTKAKLSGNLENIILIDEAYALAEQGGGDGPDYGKEAITELVKFMDANKGSYMIIAAGYEDRMNETFFANNEGLTRRFNKKYVFPPYTGDELTGILKNNLRKKSKLDGWDPLTWLYMTDLIEQTRKSSDYFVAYEKRTNEQIKELEASGISRYMAARKRMIEIMDQEKARYAPFYKLFFEKQAGAIIEIASDIDTYMSVKRPADGKKYRWDNDMMQVLAGRMSLQQQEEVADPESDVYKFLHLPLRSSSAACPRGLGISELEAARNTDQCGPEEEDDDDL
jgi:hypothetical protein